MNEEFDPAVEPVNDVPAEQEIPAVPEIPPLPEVPAAAEPEIPAAAEPAAQEPVGAYAPPQETGAPASVPQQPQNVYAPPQQPAYQPSQGDPYAAPRQPAYPQPAYQQPQTAYPYAPEPSRADPRSSEPRPGKKSPYAPMTSVGMAIQIILMSIPVLGLILMILWSCGVCRKIARRNLARAYLILLILGIILTVAAALVLRFVFPDELARAFEQVFPGYTIQWN